MHKADWKKILLIGFFSLIFISRFWVCNSGLPILEMDEGQIPHSAMRFGTGDFNPHDFLYPTFYKYLLFFIYGVVYLIGKLFGYFPSTQELKIFYFNNKEIFYLIARLFASLMGSLTAFVIYRISKKTYGNRVGFITVLFFFTSQLHFEYSKITLPDVPMTFFVTLSMYFIYRILEVNNLKNYIYAGIFGGLAISTKYNAVFVIFAMIIAFILTTYRSKEYKNKIVSGKKLFIGLSCFVIFFVIGSPYTIIDFKNFRLALGFQNIAITQNNSILDILKTYLKYIDFFMLPQRINWSEDLFGIIILAGIIYSFYRLKKSDVLSLSFIISHFLFFGFKTSYGFFKPHYMLPIIPFMYMIGARFLVEFPSFFKVSRIKQNIILILLTFVLFIFSGTKFVLLINEFSRKPTNLLTREWVEENFPNNSRILYTSIVDIALRKSKECLLEENKENSVPFLSEKLSALDKFNGKTYFTAAIHKGWVFLDSTQANKLLEIGLPSHVSLVDSKKISLEFWKQRGFEYVIVVMEDVNLYFSDEEKFSLYIKFFEEIFDRCQLIKEFIPIPRKNRGSTIRIYRIV